MQIPESNKLFFTTYINCYFRFCVFTVALAHRSSRSTRSAQSIGSRRCPTMAPCATSSGPTPMVRCSPLTLTPNQSNILFSFFTINFSVYNSTNCRTKQLINVKKTLSDGACLRAAPASSSAPTWPPNSTWTTRSNSSVVRTSSSWRATSGTSTTPSSQSGPRPTTATGATSVSRTVHARLLSSF